jgi:hypothetical protein
MLLFDECTSKPFKFDELNPKPLIFFLQENLKKGSETDFVKITAPIYFHILGNFCTKNDTHQLLLI